MLPADFICVGWIIDVCEGCLILICLSLQGRFPYAKFTRKPHEKREKISKARKQAKSAKGVSRSKSPETNTLCVWKETMVQMNCFRMEGVAGVSFLFRFYQYSITDFFHLVSHSIWCSADIFSNQGYGLIWFFQKREKDFSGSFMRENAEEFC